MSEDRFENAEYYQARAQRLREFAAGSGAETAAGLVDIAKDFDVLARLIDAEADNQALALKPKGRR